MQCVISTQRAFFDTLVAYLSLHDIHLLISALECLYSLSCLGENSCNAIVRTHGALDALVSLVTVEAQSYGPKVSLLATDRYAHKREHGKLLWFAASNFINSMKLDAQNQNNVRYQNKVGAPFCGP